MDRPNSKTAPKWQPIELTLESPEALDSPTQDAWLHGRLISPSGRTLAVDGFWDGGKTWRLRFAPDEEGSWLGQIQLIDSGGALVTETETEFRCTAPSGKTRFQRHGPVVVDESKNFLRHVDGEPFFWLADTAWNGPLLATDEAWQYYLNVRLRQKFSAVQWVATQWRAAPDGDIDGRLAFTGQERIEVDPLFFRRLDRRVQSLTAGGLLNVPVLLWAIGGGSNPSVNPGYGLPADQAALLARYMIARWSAYPSVWILAGDGRYFGDYAAKWRQIGRTLFSGKGHAPVAMHCGGMQWPAEEFRNETWMDILGYQSGHGDGDETLAWLVQGPPATEWQREPRMFQINLEPAYENHLAYQSGKAHTPLSVRRAVISSLLVAPTAGVTYGGHGVWGWDDGCGPPTDHPNSGTPLPWRHALTMPAAEQMAHLADLFAGIAWQRLMPAPDLLKTQPGTADVSRFVLASRTPEGDLAVVYTPGGDRLELNGRLLPGNGSAFWYNARSGKRTEAAAEGTESAIIFTPPEAGDWILCIGN